MPKPYHPHIVSDAATGIASRALSIDWFSMAGRAGGSQTNVQWVRNREDALADLVGQEWDDYLLDASNEMAGPIPRPQVDDWNWAVDEVSRIIQPRLPELLRARLPAITKQADDAINVICGMVRLAGIEAHFAPWVKTFFFAELLSWLEAGRLPCGGVGRYPAERLKIF